MNIKKATYLILFFLIIGVVYRLILTSNQNFLFNMDNARDMVDVREMVELLKPRLIGHTAAIDGVYYGPFWYYMSVIPFVITDGDPYGSILMLIGLWAFGGFFALKLAGRYGLASMLIVGSLWVASNVVILATVYAFNPNPAIFLTPVFVYLFDKYLKTKKTLFAVLTFGLAGMFFSFEINFAIFLPVIIVATIIASGNKGLFKRRSFWVGVFSFALMLSPHLLFELKHQFLMTNAMTKYLSGVATGSQIPTNPFDRFGLITRLFYEMLLPTFMNFKPFTNGILALSIFVLANLIHKKQIFKDNVVTILLFYILVTIIGFTLIPTTINSWHWVGVVAAAIMMTGFIISEGMKLSILSKLFTIVLLVVGVGYSISNVSQYFITPKTPSADPSLFRNEMAAVDYAYQKAEGKNFKAYVYLPSVIDYPYQYIFWWWGLKKYGYTPEDYAYEPNQFPYISQKERLSTGSNPPSSGLIFLIKEPDRIGYRELWDNLFKKYPLISSEMVGPLLIEIRKETQ